VKEVAGLLGPIIEMATAERLVACMTFCPQWGDTLFALYKICGDVARIGTKTTTVSIRLVDRLEWRARKYYDMPLLVLAPVMDPTSKGVDLKTGCDDLASWATITEFVIHYGQLFGYDVGSSVDDSAGKYSTHCFMEHMPRNVLSQGMLYDEARIKYWSTALSASKEFRLLGFHLMAIGCHTADCSAMVFICDPWGYYGWDVHLLQ
jgi:hypothetical protein